MFLFSATGVLKGYDALLNIVLDNTTEYLRGRLIKPSKMESQVTFHVAYFKSYHLR